MWIANGHRAGNQRFVVHANEKLAAFVELESASRAVHSIKSKRIIAPAEAVTTSCGKCTVISSRDIEIANRLHWQLLKQQESSIARFSNRRSKKQQQWRLSKGCLKGPERPEPIALRETN
jgi:hypothetical protein